MQKLMKLYQDEDGQGMAEYGLILALIAVAAIAGITIMGQRLLAKFNEVNGHLQ